MGSCSCSRTCMRTKQTDRGSPGWHINTSLISVRPCCCIIFRFGWSSVYTLNSGGGLWVLSPPYWRMTQWLFSFLIELCWTLPFMGCDWLNGLFEANTWSHRDRIVNRAVRVPYKDLRMVQSICESVRGSRTCVTAVIHPRPLVITHCFIVDYYLVI